MTTKKNKVLICAPIGGAKQYSINDWFHWIANQTHADYDIAICTNGKDQPKLWTLLRQVEIRDVHGQTKKLKILPLINSDKLTVIQKITYSREKLRRYAKEQGYDFIFFLDTDTIPYNLNVIDGLIAREEDVISGVYFYKHSRVPVVLDAKTHTNASISMMEDCVKTKSLFETDGFGFGVLLLSRKAFTACAFDYNLFGEDRTDDFGYCHVLTQAGFKLMCDPQYLCNHLDDPNKPPTGTMLDAIRTDGRKDLKS